MATTYQLEVACLVSTPARLVLEVRVHVSAAQDYLIGHWLQEHARVSVGMQMQE